jgi:hypothetical protein
MKKYMLGIIAFVLAISFSAFTTHQKARPGKTFTNYYEFDGSSNSGLYQTGDWVSLGTDLPSGCGGANVVCIVSASESTLGAFQSSISSVHPTSETELDNIDGVSIFSRKNP